MSILSDKYSEIARSMLIDLRTYVNNNEHITQALNAELIAKDLGMKKIKELADLMVPLSWPRMVVERKINAMKFEGFVGPEEFKLDTIFKDNDLKYIIKRAMFDASAYGCSYMMLESKKDIFNRDVIKGGVYSPNNVIAQMDDNGNIEYLLKVEYKYTAQSGINYNIIESAVLFTRNEIISFNPSSEYVYDIIEHNNGWIPAVKITNKPTTVNPYGTSDITRSTLSSTMNAMRALKDTVIISDLSKVAQRYVAGKLAIASDSDDFNFNEAIQEYADAITVISSGMNGEPLNIGQWDQSSPNGSIQVFETFASTIASEHGIPMTQLIKSSGNPEAAEAIDAQSATLYERAHDSSVDYTKPILDFIKMFVVYNNDGDIPVNISDINVMWGNPKTINYSSTADGIYKLIESQVITPNSFLIAKMLGLSQSDMEAIEKEREVWHSTYGDVNSDTSGSDIIKQSTQVNNEDVTDSVTGMS